MLELGKSLLATGDAVSDIEVRLRDAAKAYGQPDARVMVLPTVVAIAGGPRQPATLAALDTDGSLGSAGPQLRLDQITEVLQIARAASAGEMPPDRGLEALGRVPEMPSRYNPFVTIIGYVVVTLGIGLIIEPSVRLLGRMPRSAFWWRSFARALARSRFGDDSSGVAALTVSAIAFAASGRYEAAPLAELIAPLVLFLPGALLTMATVDLASTEVVTGASRFLAGLLQLALLAFGILAGATLVGVAAGEIIGRAGRSARVVGALARRHGVRRGNGATALRSAPLAAVAAARAVRRMGRSAPRTGAIRRGLSGFVGGLVVAPLATVIQRFPSAPPALVSFLPAFWLLVPGALGLIGFTQLAATSPALA